MHIRQLFVNTVVIVGLVFLLSACSLFPGNLVSGNGESGSDEVVNLLRNPGFEDLTDGVPEPWRFNGNWSSGIATATEEAARSGDYGVMIFEVDEEKSGTWTYDLSQNHFPIESGKSYKASVWVKGDNEQPPSRILMRVKFYGPNTGETSFNETLVGFDPDAWMELSQEVTAPDDAVTATIYLRPTFPGKIYIDDALFIEIESGD